MSDKEKNLVEQLKELPADIQDKFLLMAQGAAVAVDCAKAREEKDEAAAAETGETDCHGAAPLAMTELAGDFYTPD